VVRRATFTEDIMAIWDKVKQGIDKAGKAAQDVFDEGKLRIESYRAREQADKAAEALGYAIFRASEAGGELEADARQRLLDALRTRDAEARKLEIELANERAKAGAEHAPSSAPVETPVAAANGAPEAAATPPGSPPPGSL
jgi:hypothetical protein